MNETSKIYDWKTKDIGLKTDEYLYFSTLFEGCLRWPDAIEQQGDLFGTEQSLTFLPSSLLQTGNKVWMPEYPAKQLFGGSRKRERG